MRNLLKKQSSPNIMDNDRKKREVIKKIKGLINDLNDESRLSSVEKEEIISELESQNKHLNNAIQSSAEDIEPFAKKIDDNIFELKKCFRIGATKREIDESVGTLCKSINDFTRKFKGEAVTLADDNKPKSKRMEDLIARMQRLKDIRDRFREMDTEQDRKIQKIQIDIDALNGRRGSICREGTLGMEADLSEIDRKKFFYKEQLSRYQHDKYSYSTCYNVLNLYYLEADAIRSRIDISSEAIEELDELLDMRMIEGIYKNPFDIGVKMDSIKEKIRHKRVEFDVLLENHFDYEANATRKVSYDLQVDLNDKSEKNIDSILETIRPYLKNAINNGEKSIIIHIASEK